MRLDADIIIENLSVSLSIRLGISYTYILLRVCYVLVGSQGVGESV